MRPVRILLILICSLLISPLQESESHLSNNLVSDIQTSPDPLVDSLYRTMSLDEKIGQLFMIRAHSNLKEDHIQGVLTQIEKYHVGSLCFFQGTPEKQLELTNQYQRKSKIPLLVAMDAEWGLGMRLKENAVSFPRQMTLGAVNDDRVIYQMGLEIGRHLKRIGVHMNFAPVIDVNNNKENPVINDRSFGEDPMEVAKKAEMYMRGMQDEGVLACAKHFPGHGDTDMDSHHDLPVIDHPYSRLKEIELKPFEYLFDRKVDAVMIAHLHVPTLDNTPNLPTSLSEKVVTSLLKKELNFNGLVVSDAMEMKGVTKHFKSGDAELMAFQVGTDIICLPNNIDQAFNKIKQAVLADSSTLEKLEISVKKILKSKQKLGLFKEEVLWSKNLKEDLFTANSQELLNKIYGKALTLVGTSNIVPIEKSTTSKIGLVSIGKSKLPLFEDRLKKYGITSSNRISKGVWSNALVSSLSKKDIVIAAFHDMSRSPSKQYGISDLDVEQLKKLSAKTNVIIVLFGNVYALQYFDDFPSVLCAYEDNERVQDVAAQALFGARSISGKLPVTVTPKLKKGDGLLTPNLFRIGYDTPESVGVNGEKLLRLDSLALEMIKDKVMPGCQMLVAKDGKIIYQKSFGHHTYAKKIRVENTHMFDVASMTKILATNISLMQLFDQGKISVFSKMSEYIPTLKKSNKKDLLIEDILIHKSGLRPWIPFYENTLNKYSKPSTKWYSTSKKDKFNIRINSKLYMHRDLLDTIRSQITESELRTHGRYRYSDLGFILFADLVKNVSGQPLDQYAKTHFYDQLSLTKTMFNPLLHGVNNNMIPPTDKDDYFRYKVIDGNVHDMGAAMLGGVSGHAGLFSNAYDVSVIMQMLLNGGYYGGHRFFHPVTVSLFTARPGQETRRGLGFDMKQLDLNKKQNVAESASYRTFGHMGFTGTCVWSDPTYNLTFVFLSNRTYPTMKVNKLSKGNYRQALLEMVYEAFE